MPSDPPTPGDALIADLTQSGGVIVAHLAKAVNADPDDVIALADLVECNFPGYAPVMITDFEDVEPDNQDLADVLSAAIQFTAAGLTTPQTAVAFYLTAHVGSDPAGFLSLEFFGDGFTFMVDGDQLVRQVRFERSLDS